MITIIYAVKPQFAEAEKEWLKEQKIYPAVQNHWDNAGNPTVRFAMILPPDTAMLVKLRHKLDLQKDYFQR
jgi:hypothetical protein